MFWSTWTSGYSNLLSEWTDPDLVNDAWDAASGNEGNSYKVYYVWGWCTSMYRDEGDNNNVSKIYAIRDVSKVKITAPSGMSLNFSEIKLFDSAGKNVALRKEAFSWTELGLSYYPTELISKATYNSGADTVTLSNMTQTLGKKLFDWVVHKIYSNGTYLSWNSYTSDQKYEIINEFMKNWRIERTSWFSAYSSSSGININNIGVYPASGSNSFTIYGYSDFTTDWHSGQDYGRFLFYNGSLYKRSSTAQGENLSVLNTTYSNETSIDLYVPNEMYPHINIPDAIAYNSSGAVIGGYDAGSKDANNVIGGMSRTHTNPHHGIYFTTYHSPSGVTGSNLEVSLNGAYDITRTINWS